MRLALVPLVMAEDIPGLPAARPQLPESCRTRWGQASSLWTPQGMVLVWLDVDDAEAVDLAREGVGIVGDHVRWSRGDHELMRRAHPRTQDLLDATAEVHRAMGSSRLASVRRTRGELLSRMCDESLIPARDCVAAYREVAERVEREHFGDPGPGIFGLTVLHTDNFNRSDRALNGDTMSDGVGTWATNTASKPKIVSNQAEGDNTGAWEYARDSAMSATGRIRTSLTFRSGNAMAATRVDSSHNGYGGYSFGGGGEVLMFRNSSGFTQLGGSGGALSAGDAVSCDSDGSSHSTLRNGSVVIGPVTDTTYATGAAGFWASSGVIDDWQVETDAASTTRGTPFGSRGTAFNGGRTFMGVIR